MLKFAVRCATQLALSLALTAALWVGDVLAQPAVVGNGSGSYAATPNHYVTTGPGLGQAQDSGIPFAGSGTPTIASGFCGAGANGAIVAGSTNLSGELTIGATTATSCIVTFGGTVATAPNACLLFPENATAAATGTTVARVASVTTAGFGIAGSALASANYYYICI